MTRIHRDEVSTALTRAFRAIAHPDAACIAERRRIALEVFRTVGGFVLPWLVGALCLWGMGSLMTGWNIGLL